MKTAVSLIAAPLLTLGVLLSPLSALAQDTEAEKTIEERREEARVERLWNMSWRQFAPFYVEYEGDFISVPNYDRRSPSSTGQSISAHRSDSAWEQEYTDERGNKTSRKLVKPEEEAFAAVALIPKVEPGQYGYIHSGNIESITDDKTVELEEVWLVDTDAVKEEKQELKEKLWGELLGDIDDAIRDRDRRNWKRNRGDGVLTRRNAENEAIDWGFESREAAARRQRDSVYARYTWVVKGFATGALKEDARWPSENAKADGLQLVIVKVEDRTVTALPAATIGKGITELQFIDYLISRDLNKAKFVEMVSEAKRESRTGYVELVLAQLEGGKLPSRDAGNDEIKLAD